MSQLLDSLECIDEFMQDSASKKKAGHKTTTCVIQGANTHKDYNLMALVLFHSDLVMHVAMRENKHPDIPESTSEETLERLKSDAVFTRKVTDEVNQLMEITMKYFPVR